MGRVLNAHELAGYHERGFHFPLRALPRAEATQYAERLASFAAANDTGIATSQLLRSKAHLASIALYELIHNEAILNAVEDILGPNILCWASGVFDKTPGDPAFVAWHQDATYWGLAPPDVVTAWLALTDATLANGAMKVLPGSHRRLMGHRKIGRAHNMLQHGQEIAEDLAEDKAVPLLLAAGKFSLHHVQLAHASEPNRSHVRRIGYAIRYVAPHVRSTDPTRQRATLVRGRDPFGHFAAEPVPRFDFDPDCVRVGVTHNQAERAAANVDY